MQNAETVLGVLRERGRRGLPCEELYRQMFNPQLYLLAYGRIYANKGAMTPGTTQETADGMSMRKISRIIEAMRHERYRFRPVRRVHIPKKNGKTRPLGMPTWSDKLAGEVVRLLLEAYYEPVFSGRSHGFRPGRGCHTALREVANTWTGTTWFVEGDIADCFGSFDHQVMLSILAEKICDNRFLRLVRNMLTAGYLEDWRWGATLSGVPQGGIASPVLSNYLSAQAGRLCRDGPDPGIHPGQAPGSQPGVPQGGRGDRQSPPERRPCCGAVSLPAAAQPSQPGPS
jgi:group II intron reverse transcriptase/maturase